MMGTAAMPHVLTRYYTTPSVSQARRSVAWSLSFIVPCCTWQRAGAGGDGEVRGVHHMVGLPASAACRSG
jgi:hypothetical protein